jgi:hypothetical protein
VSDLALLMLYDAVVARFALDGTATPNVFGWRSSAQQMTTGKRIVWIPGDPNGNAGSVISARNPGRNVRPLATLEELFTVEISAMDIATPENERAQYEATRLVFDAWYRAVYLAARGTFRVISDEWVTDKKERRYGATMRIVCAIEAMIPDAVQTEAPVDTHAEVDVLELDETDTFTTPLYVRAATTAAITLSGLQTVDDVVLAAGDRVLVKDQADGATNGVYVAAAGAWARAADADTSAEVVNGISFWVNEGTSNDDGEFELTTANPITLGTTALVFALKST